MIPQQQQDGSRDGADVDEAAFAIGKVGVPRAHQAPRLADLQASAIAVAARAAALDVRLPAGGAQLLADGVETGGVRGADAQIERAVLRNVMPSMVAAAPRCARSRPRTTRAASAPSPPPPRTSASRLSTRRRALVAFC